MEKNIFEGAKFGDKFVTRDGRKALYLFDTTCWVDRHYESEIDYDRDGSWGYESGEGPLDIVSRYQESIDEDKLDVDSNLYAAHIAGDDKSLFRFIKLAMEYGYRKAMEE